MFILYYTGPLHAYGCVLSQNRRKNTRPLFYSVRYDNQTRTEPSWPIDHSQNSFHTPWKSSWDDVSHDVLHTFLITNDFVSSGCFWRESVSVCCPVTGLHTLGTKLLHIFLPQILFKSILVNQSLEKCPSLEMACGFNSNFHMTLSILGQEYFTVYFYFPYSNNLLIIKTSIIKNNYDINIEYCILLYNIEMDYVY